MKNLFLVTFLVAAFFVGLFGLTVVTPILANAQGQTNDNFTRVLIAFDKPVGASERALVRAYGGKIKYSYLFDYDRLLRVIS